MKSDAGLEKLLRQAVDNSEEAAEQALGDRLITMDALHPANPAHVRLVEAWVQEHDEIPPDRFISKLGTGTIVQLLRKCPALLSYVSRDLRKDPDQAGCVIKAWLEVNSNAETTQPLPTEWLPLLKGHLLTVEFAQWEVVTPFLPPDIVTQWSLVREQKRGQLEEEQKEARRKKKEQGAVPRIDPLMEALKKREIRRLRNIQLETLKPQRWENVKETWRGCNRMIRARMVRLPWELVKDDAKDALECWVGEGEDGDTLNIAWPVSKDLFKSLDLTMQVKLLRRIILEGDVDGGVKVRPLLKLPEIDQLLVGAVLADPKNSRLAEWFNLIKKIKQLKRLDRPCSPSDLSLTIRDKQVLSALAMSYDEGDLRMWLDEPAEESEFNQVLEVVDWCLRQPAGHRRAIARHLYRDERFERALNSFTADELTSPKFLHG